MSIDDREVAHLRLLLDEVFGEAAFLAQVVVNLNAKGRQLGGGFAVNHEYLLVYARDPRRCRLDPTSPDAVDPADFGHTADDGRRYRLLPLRNTNKRFRPTTAPTLHYPSTATRRPAASPARPSTARRRCARSSATARRRCGAGRRPSWPSGPTTSSAARSGAGWGSASTCSSATG
ncbi:hypothetical protein [Nocardioides zeae]